MSILKFTTHAYRIPLRGGWEDAVRRLTHLDLVVCDVHGDITSGTGLTFTSGVGTHAVLALIGEDIAGRLVGAEAHPRVVWHQIRRDLGETCGIAALARAAVDIALWDLYAKAAQRPLVDIIGPLREVAPAYGSGVNLHLTLDELADQVRDWLAADYQAVKIKVGKPDLADDLERVELVRSLIGSHRRLMLDANQSWDLAAALRAMRAFARFDPYWVEEPLPAGDISGHVQLRKLTQTPIAVGESLYALSEFRMYLESGGCDVLQPSVARVGITRFLEIANLAMAWNVPIAPHLLPELSGQLLRVIPNGLMIEAADGFQIPWRVDGAASGHGIVLDRDKIDRYRLTLG